MTKICPTCGSEINYDALRCPYCWWDVHNQTEEEKANNKYWEDTTKVAIVALVVCGALMVPVCLLMFLFGK